jgi:hypothetical protein
MAVSKNRKTQRTVLFEVRTAKPLAVGQQVFVTGNQKMLGFWRADALPLTRMGENTWSGQAILPVTEAVEYKFTRGSWSTEAVGSDGVVPGNHELRAGGDITVRHTVAAWKDQFD